ncbi:MAG TPA: glycosyltransferase family 2 protein [Anaeromyxobacteraceae bacterium]|nr:glycosyltransferase family 2 protein [Anaeromyxobacteraceae bacterium]
MRLGGYVIHGDSRDTLARCLDSLLAVCDEVVAVDSGSTDGSARLVDERGVRRIVHPWEGFGAARRVAAEALAHCDYQLFLDSDEWLEPGAAERLRAWKASRPDRPLYAVTRRDWADLPTGRFLFSSELQVRIARSDAAKWDPRNLVHEALPRRDAVRTGIPIEHRFATDVAAVRAKEERYALLWALDAHARGKRPRAPLPRLLVHAFRFGIVKGAALRGGSPGLELAWVFARYHARKHELLAEIARGGHPEAVAALREGRLRDLYAIVNDRSR